MRCDGSLDVDQRWARRRQLAGQQDLCYRPLFQPWIDIVSDVKQMAPGIYKGDKVTKDSASDFQMEGKSLNGKPNFYRAIPAEAKLCILEVTYENPASASEAEAVIDSLKAK